MNPLEWGPWLYGKFFANHHPFWGYLFACSVALLIALMAWTQIKDKYEAEHRPPTITPSSIVGAQPEKSSPSKPIAIITGSKIHDNKGPGIINETGQPMIIEGGEISGNKGAGIISRPPGQQADGKKKPSEKP